METKPLPLCVRQLRAGLSLLPEAPPAQHIHGMAAYTEAAIALEAALEIVARESLNMDIAKSTIAASVLKTWAPSEIPSSLRNALTR